MCQSMDYTTMNSPNSLHGSQFSQLNTQDSLYNLTFGDEVHTQLGKLGKPLNTVNNEEDDQLIPISSSSSSSSSSPASSFIGNVNLNQKLNKKPIIDEVWRELVHQENVNLGEKSTVQEQMTLGEMTLEDFLVRVGIDPQPLMGIDPMVVKPFMSMREQNKLGENSDWLSSNTSLMPIQAVVDSNFQVSELGSETSVVDVDMSYPNDHLALPMPTYSESLMGVERKRKFAYDTMEKTIERRQKRMIKNRESAARSRARKQAYTNQLENEVFALRRTNHWLKKQKEVEKLLNVDAAHAPRYQLRRTSSATV